MMFDDEDTPAEEPRGCLHCMIWRTIHEWGGDTLSPREYRNALSAIAMIMADVVSHSAKNGVTQDQIVSVFNAMFNAAMKDTQNSATHTSDVEGDDADLATDRVIN